MGDQKRVRVLVELRVPSGSKGGEVMALARGLDAPSFSLDSSYDAVPVRPTSDQVEEFAARNLEVVVVRGTIDAADIPRLEARPEVIRVWFDAPIAPFGDMSPRASDRVIMPGMSKGPCPIPPCDCTYGNPAIGDIPAVAAYLGADKIWAEGVKGCGIVIGIVDGGIAAQGRPPQPGQIPRIPRVSGGWPDDWGTIAGWDEHGNMTAWDALGMAPGANIFDIRISGGPTIPDTISIALAAYRWVIDRHRIVGTPHILSNSWGVYQRDWAPDYAVNPDHPFTRTVEEALDEGILVLFAAGNCGETCPAGSCGSDTGPGHSIWGANGHEWVMTVGAANLREQWVGYSSQGPASLCARKPDFCSLTHFAGYFPTQNPSSPSDTGTSAATPIAAGVVALLLQVNCDLTQNRVKTLLMQTAKDIGPRGWDNHSGAGIIQAKDAYDRLRTGEPWPIPTLGRACLLHVYNTGVQLGWADVYAWYPANQATVVRMLEAARAHAEAAEIFVAPEVLINVTIERVGQLGITNESRCVIRSTEAGLSGQLRDLRCTQYSGAVLANIYGTGQILAWAHARMQFIGQSGEPISNIKGLLRGALAHAEAARIFPADALGMIRAAIVNTTASTINRARETLAAVLDNYCCDVGVPPPTSRVTAATGC
ncbi:MAG: S8 family peptidase [Acidobacteria bacterium]|nr:S8 family peptidase [Acidobacteriota bacterium]